jgi:hypothetical protein
MILFFNSNWTLFAVGLISYFGISDFTEMMKPENLNTEIWQRIVHIF